MNLNKIHKDEKIICINKNTFSNFNTKLELLKIYTYKDKIELLYRSSPKVIHNLIHLNEIDELVFSDNFVTIDEYNLKICLERKQKILKLKKKIKKDGKTKICKIMF